MSHLFKFHAHAPGLTPQSVAVEDKVYPFAEDGTVTVDDEHAAHLLSHGAEHLKYVEGKAKAVVSKSKADHGKAGESKA